MPGNEVFRRAFEAVKRRFDSALEGITPEQLAYRPHPEANSIAWLAWHLTRWQDTQVSRFAGREQAWLDGWSERFGRPADPGDTGLGHDSAAVAGLQASPELLLAYHQAVFERTLSYLRDATEAELAREVDDPLRGKDQVQNRLVGVLSDNFQHAGQMAYLRGLLAGAHWGGH